MKVRKSTAEFIEEVKAVHGDKFDYSLTVFTKTHDKITIICKTHGEFKQIAKDHRKGNGCPICAKTVRAAKRVLTTSTFIEYAQKIHGDKYNYSFVEYKGCRNKIKIICKKHGEFYQTPNNHTNGFGCVKCGHEADTLKRSSNTDSFIAKAQLVHGKKYDYSLVNYINNKHHVTIVCKEHGAFEQSPSQHLSGKNCRKCAGNEAYTTESFIAKAKSVHGDIYDYSRTVYKAGTRKILINCPKHGDFFKQGVSHLMGSGCKLCYFDRAGSSVRLSTEEFIVKAKKIHGKRYNYSKVVYRNQQSKVEVMCKKHGLFRVMAGKHLYDNAGCQKCQISKGEMAINSILCSLGVSFEPQKRFLACVDKRPLPFDFHIPSKNLLIEYDGEQHFKSIPQWGGEKALKQTQKRDQIKSEFAKKNGFLLLRIKYTDFDRIEEILSEALSLKHQPIQLTLFAA